MAEFSDLCKRARYYNIVFGRYVSGEVWFQSELFELNDGYNTAGSRRMIAVMRVEA